ncbi:hypothetical protein JRQ81_007563 [Phrynocephalus forsythii]|uniref:G2 and S phase-expressed protein 1 N-terminal domain-containing protein n=1 Tax=Phrynocephalus forsythii TaxID=171643 RepID=A0A9Q1AT65_9SAUR|nr:hypothetical protein JRQ81_007563 [Phrynocephalus forsythii]
MRKRAGGGSCHFKWENGGKLGLVHGGGGGGGRGFTMEEEKITLQSECKMIEAKSKECVTNNVPLLTDEKFDFDLSLSPTSENEDEVFVGPMGHKEKCVATFVENQKQAEDKISPLSAEELIWSPLAGEKFVEIFKEAHLVALQLQSASKPKRKKTGTLEEQKSEAVDKFVQESKSKLKILEKGIVVDKTPKTIKRETYCVSEIPPGRLPLSLQKPSQRPVKGTDGCHSPQALLRASSPGRREKLSEASPVHLAQGKSDKSSKRTSTSQSPKPARLLSSSSRNNLNSMGSSEDLLSDRSSVTSDGGDVSFCNSSSVQEKRTLPTPSKVDVFKHKTRQLKPPSNVRMRRNTSSSSSSSVSSMNSSFSSSLSISPKRGKGNKRTSSKKCNLIHYNLVYCPVQTTVALKAAANPSQLSSSASKISAIRPTKGSLMPPSHANSSGKPQRTSSDTEGNPVSVPKQKTVSVGEASGPGSRKGGSDSAQKLLQKSSLANIRASSSPKLKTKTVPPLSKEVTPPIRRSEGGIALNPCSAAKSAVRSSSSNVRLSALPTPVGQRVSGIPMLTPKTLPRLMCSPNPVPLHQISSMSSKKTAAHSSKYAKESETRETSSSSSMEEDLSPPEVAPIALCFSPENSSGQMEEKPTETEKPDKESLLIDIGLDNTSVAIDKTPLVIQECETKPLIDLFNTPEVLKVLPLKAAVQLIDLSSPLIQLGPEENKENLDSPLLKF